MGHNSFYVVVEITHGVTYVHILYMYSAEYSIGGNMNI